MAKLILVRHGVTSWNKIGRWQGKTDVPLSPEGAKQIEQAGKVITNIKIDKIFTSTLARVKQSEWVLVKDLNLSCPVVESATLDERDYGIYTGKNKWDFEKEYGEEIFEKVRRGFNTPIPGGETLEDVYNRVVPFLTQSILPEIRLGKNILVVSSGNTIRVMMKYLETLTDNEVEKTDLGFAQITCYELDSGGSILQKEILFKGIYN